MKKVCAVILCLLLTGCGSAADSSYPDSIVENPPAGYSFEKDDVILITTSKYDGEDFCDITTINAAGEKRFHSKQITEIKGQWLEIAEDMKKLEPAAAMSREETDTLTGYLSKIDPSAPWIEDDHTELPEALEYTISYYTVLDGELVRLESWYYYPDYLDDENAIAALEYIKNKKNKSD